jgi:hypothetical protein
MGAAMEAARSVTSMPRRVIWQDLAEQGEYRLRLPGLQLVADELGLIDEPAAVTPAIEACSSKFYQGFLRATGCQCCTANAIATGHCSWPQWYSGIGIYRKLFVDYWRESYPVCQGGWLFRCGKM